MVTVAAFVARVRQSPFVGYGSVAPWYWASHGAAWIAEAMTMLGDNYVVRGGVAIHRTATVEAGAVVKGPAILGPDSFVATTAYLRGGVFLDDGCIVGPGAEVKTSFLFAGAKLAHLNFVGDSVLGAGVNVEAGAMIANYRNERADKQIRVAYDGRLIDTGVEKFGALVGDGVRIGANAVIAPGAILEAGAVIPRLSLVDQAG